MADSENAKTPAKKREARFCVIDEIRSKLPSVPEEEIAGDIAAAITEVCTKPSTP